MIEENSVRYLDRGDIERIHSVLSTVTTQQGEPIPPFSLAKDGDLDALISAPRQRFYDQEAYPTLAEKAAIIFYTVNKRQIFLNGNKRMSTLCFLVFLKINDKAFDVLPDELTAKALWLSQTSSMDFPEIKTQLIDWIEAHLKDAPQENYAASGGASSS